VLRERSKDRALTVREAARFSVSGAPNARGMPAGVTRKETDNERGSLRAADFATLPAAGGGEKRANYGGKGGSLARAVKQPDS